MSSMLLEFEDRSCQVLDVSVSLDVTDLVRWRFGHLPLVLTPSMQVDLVENHRILHKKVYLYLYICALCRSSWS